MNELRILIDTGVIVSAVWLPRSIPRRAFDVAAEHGRLLLSNATAAELDDVVRRRKFNRYTQERERLEFLAGFIRKAEIVEIAEVVTGCRDPKDDKYLELAVNGRARYLVSGDADLLVLNPFRGIEILTPQAFLSAIQRVFE